MSEVENFLSLAEGRAASDPLQLSIRQLLGMWGFQRRG